MVFAFSREIICLVILIDLENADADDASESMQIDRSAEATPNLTEVGDDEECSDGLCVKVDEVAPPKSGLLGRILNLISGGR